MQDPDLERWWLQDVKTGSGGYSASYSMGTGEVKEQAGEVDLSPPSRKEVRHQWICTCTLLYAFKVWTKTTLIFFSYNRKG
jgi:hypothetical protein